MSFWYYPGMKSELEYRRRMARIGIAFLAMSIFGVPLLIIALRG